MLTKRHALICFLVLFSLFGPHATAQGTVKASSFGYSSSNATSALEKTLKSSYSKIIVDYKSGGWNIEPIKIFDVKDKEIVFESGVVLRAIKGKFSGRNDALLNLVRAKNIMISGYGATFKMSRSELQSYDSRTEYRHSLRISGGDGITVKGLTLDESGGDGIYITGSNALSYSKDIVLEDLKVVNHSRDGISIISADRLTVKNCTFSGTKSNILGCGINFEPNASDQRLTNITFQNCTIKDNYFYGIQVSLKHMQSSSTAIGIKFENCTLTNNYTGNKNGGNSEIRLGVGSSFNNAVTGQITFQDVLVENVSHSVVSSRKPSTAFKAKFIDCTFKDVASNASAIYLETPSYSITSPPLGGFEFDNVKISSSSSDPFLKINGWKTMDGLKDVTGDFIIANPNLNKDNAIGYKNVSKFSNVDVDFQLVASISSSGSGSGSGSDSDSPDDTGGSSSGSCTNTLSVTSIVSSATVKQAATSLTASSTVSHGSGLVQYKANSKVTLKPGFKTSADGEEVFKASLGDCTSSSSKVASLKAKIGFYHNWNPEVEVIDERVAKPILSPNPIMNIASLNFMLDVDDHISINVYDMNNQLVQPIINDEKLYAGPQEVELNISSLRAGIYFVSIEGSLEKQFIKAIKR